jgi:hypothetical protein
LGKARALKLGIVKGVAKAGTAFASNMPLKCPVCHTKFNLQDLFIQEKNGGPKAIEAINDHMRMCIGRAAPGKVIKHSCGEEISIEQLDDHLLAKHQFVRINGRMMSPDEKAAYDRNHAGK